MLARLKIGAAAVVVALAGMMTLAMAAGFPYKDITLVVPFSLEPGTQFQPG